MLARRLGFAIAIAVSLPLAHADDSADSICDSYNTAEARDCYGAQIEKTEKRLERVVAKRLQELNFNSEDEEEGWSKRQVVELKRAFVRSQANWAKYRDYWCSYKGRLINGTGADSENQRCLLKAMNQRIEEIEQ